MTVSIANWLGKIGLGQYTGLFVANEVDLTTLRVLTNADLKELGLPFGPRKWLLNALKQEVELGSDRPAPEGERRQLTVLFCDMVESTELSQRVDPEVLQTIHRLYEDACAACISHYDGYIYQRRGDGIIAFFGFPLAHEGEAARAIRSGLEIVEAIARLEVPEIGRLRVHIGIATGIVVVAAGERNVGDLLGDPDPALEAALFRRREVAGNAVHLGVVEAIGRALVVGGEPLEYGGALEDEVGLVGGTAGRRGEAGNRHGGHEGCCAPAVSAICHGVTSSFRPHVGTAGESGSRII